MSKELIEEMLSIINDSDPHYVCKDTRCRDCDFFFVKKNCYAAKALYNAGYRKQREAEWREDFDGDCYCTACGYYPKKDVKNFCPDCGAKMKPYLAADKPIYTHCSGEFNNIVAELMEDYAKLVKKAKSFGLDIRLYDESETLELYFNDDYPDTLLVDKDLSSIRRAKEG